MKKIIIAALAIVGLLLTTACEVPEEDNKPGAQRATTKAKDAKSKAAKPKNEGPKETVSQANARASAEGYVEMSGFSRKGLINQLKYEDFSQKDAIYGADSVNANWNKEAVESAKTYLEMSSFSRQGLIDQLKYEGFTPQQAEYGVSKTGL